MGGYLNIPVYLTTPPPPQLSRPPPQIPNLPMLYYGIVVVATATSVLSIYHLILVRLCNIQYHHRRRNSASSNTAITPPSPSISGGSSAGVGYLISSFKYKNGGNSNNYDYNLNECSVCLSVFEEGEEVKKLPVCNHCFHALCIDMWLNSHIQCPLCRAVMVAPPRSLWIPSS